MQFESQRSEMFTKTPYSLFHLCRFSSIQMHAYMRFQWAKATDAHVKCAFAFTSEHSSVSHAFGKTQHMMVKWTAPVRSHQRPHIEVAANKMTWIIRISQIFTSNRCIQIVPKVEFKCRLQHFHLKCKLKFLFLSFFPALWLSLFHLYAMHCR